MLEYISFELTVTIQIIKKIDILNGGWKLFGNQSGVGTGPSGLGQEVRGRSSKLRLVSLVVEYRWRLNS